LLIFASSGLEAGTLPAVGNDDITEHFSAFDPASARIVSDLDWGLFFLAYVARDETSGVNLVGYGAVTPLDRTRLKNYLGTLQMLSITVLNLDEQLWPTGSTSTTRSPWT
jgi:hypothetical protein